MINFLFSQNIINDAKAKTFATFVEGATVGVNHTYNYYNYNQNHNKTAEEMWM